MKILPSHPASTLRSVVTFLNHGILPFVGREGDVATILDFWRGTVGEPSAAAMLVTAEAGMGKSRLADEIVLRVEQESGAAVHLRFYPDSSLSLAPLLSGALRLAAARRQLLGSSADGGDNIALLRRLTHLRPTILVLEDIHLLAGNPLRELQEMLQAVRDLPLAILFLTRPIELPTRGVIEPWMAGELQLTGLDEDDVARLVQELFGLSDTDWLPGMLHRITLGNPLAVRSAIRAAVTSRGLEHLANDSWRVALDQRELEKLLVRGVHLLTEGMVAHLSPEERVSAEELAELGEVFAPETARAMIPGIDSVIERLLFRGVLSSLELPISPLVGERQSEGLIAFSHTLLHRSLVGRRSLAREQVLIPLAAWLPFYSTHLLERLGTAAGELSNPDTLYAAVDQLRVFAVIIDSTADWQIAPRLLDAADALHRLHLPVLDEQVGHHLELLLLQARCSVMRREDGSQKYAGIVERFLHATEEPMSPELRSFRLVALKQKYVSEFRRDILVLEKSWEEIEQLLERHPELRFTTPYMYYLRSVVFWAVMKGNTVMARMVERQLLKMESDDRMHEDLRSLARRAIWITLITLFSTPEELEQRERLLVRIESDPSAREEVVVRHKIRLLTDTGRIGELLAALDEWIPRFEGMGLTRNATKYRLLAIMEPAAFDGDLLEIAGQVRTLITATPDLDRASLRQVALAGLSAKTILMGRPEKSLDFAREFGGINDPALGYDLKLIVALASDEIALVEALLDEEYQPWGVRSLARLIYGPAEESSFEEAVVEVRRNMQMPLLRTNDLLGIYILLDLIGRQSNAGDKRLEHALQRDIRDGIEKSMKWMEERGMTGYMLPLLQRHGRWLTRRQSEEWMGRINRVVRERKMRQQESPRQQMLRIRMLGAFEATRQDGDVVTIRGGRLRALLGLLVADRMLSLPLGHREFCRIASGEEDPERARKTMNGAVMRLREVLGENAIDTDGETPRLDLALVGVDLLDAFELCRSADEALRRGRLANALPRVRQALDIWNGEVPFPALYESFFEATREDFENMIATTTMLVCRALLAENDPGGAEELLRRATPMLPGDEAMAQLLIEALERSGRKADAERVRLAGE